MSALRRTASLFVLLALAWQSTGVATAFEREGLVHCCCGDHAAEHACRCAKCPRVGKLRFMPPREKASSEEPSPYPTVDDCRGSGHAIALAQLETALSLVPPRLEAPSFAAAPTFSEDARLHDRLIESVRPPP